MALPLVSIICTSYNHGDFITGSLDSVIRQNYGNLELIIIDNGSQDETVRFINEWLGDHKGTVGIKAFFHQTTINYCRSFNQGLSTAKGKYIVDLSGDDVLLQGHLENAVEALEKGTGAVYFSNAYLVEGSGAGHPKTFYPVSRDGSLLSGVASGDVYALVVQKNFLCAPTLVFKAEALVDEGGYDERLSYEDFDIIVRMARKYEFIFNEHIGVRKRVLKSSFSAQQYKAKTSIMLPSTLEVCRKIQSMNRSKEENQALALRVMYETKHALASANFIVAEGFLELANEIGVSSLEYHLFKAWAKFRLDLSPLYTRIMLR